jgi:hypothetical protein
LVANGSTHDFKMLKNSKIHINETIEILADLGFLGIKKIHQNSTIPHKNSKKKKLTKQQKKENKALSSQRIVIEHVNRFMKIFLILKYPYRNKQKRFGLRVNLIAAVYNQNNIKI